MAGIKPGFSDFGSMGGTQYPTPGKPPGANTTTLDASGRPTSGYSTPLDIADDRRRQDELNSQDNARQDALYTRQRADQVSDQKTTNDQRNALMQQALGGLSNSSGPRAGGGAWLGDPSAGLPGPAPGQPGSVQSAEDAAYARAKDKITESSRGAEAGVKEQMASRGLSGSGIETEGMLRTNTAAQGQLGDFARTQATDGLERAMHDRDQAQQWQMQQSQQRADILRSFAGMY